MSAPNLLRLAQSIHANQFGSAPLITPDLRGRFCDAFCKLANAVPSTDLRRWGRKSRPRGGGPMSTGTVAWCLEGQSLPASPQDCQVDAVDLIAGDGHVQWLTEPAAEYQNIFATWYPVEPAPAEPGPIKPPPPDDPLERAIALLEGFVTIGEHLIGAVDRLASSLEAAGKHGIPLNIQLPPKPPNA